MTWFLWVISSWNKTNILTKQKYCLIKYLLFMNDKLDFIQLRPTVHGTWHHGSPSTCIGNFFFVLIISDEHWANRFPDDRSPVRTWPIWRQFSRPTTSICLSPMSVKHLNNRNYERLSRINKVIPISIKDEINDTLITLNCCWKIGVHCRTAWGHFFADWQKFFFLLLLFTGCSGFGITPHVRTAMRGRNV